MKATLPDFALSAKASRVTLPDSGMLMNLTADALAGPAAASASSTGAEAAEFVLFEMSDGRLVRGCGPFARSAVAPDDGWAFYVNDFALSETRPWLIPAALEVLSPESVKQGEFRKPLRWKAPEPGAFREVFDDLMARIHRGGLRKAVPAAVERTVWLEEDWKEFVAGLAPGAGGAIFACQLGDEGFAGRSPEMLFELHDTELHTMALAGTAPADQSAQILENSKLLREHGLVVEVLRKRLSTLGEVRVGERAILPLGSMAHLCTKLETTLPQHDADRGEELIHLLHPTPALGIEPRTPATLELLLHCREQLGVPRAFGAPFGVKWPGGFEVRVAIRGVFWKDGEAFLPAGCGLVEGSEFESEWAELELKRRWVHHALHF